MSKFAKANGGGSDKISSRVIGGELLMELVSFSFGPGQNFPLVKNGIIKAQLVSPPQKILDGVCKLMVPTTLNEFVKKDRKPLLVRVESVLDDARRLCNSLGVDPSKVVKIIGRLDVRAVLFVAKKTMDFENKEYKDVKEIAEAACAHMCAHSFSDRPLICYSKPGSKYISG